MLELINDVQHLGLVVCESDGSSNIKDINLPFLGPLPPDTEFSVLFRNRHTAESTVDPDAWVVSGYPTLRVNGAVVYPITINGHYVGENFCNDNAIIAFIVTNDGVEIKSGTNVYYVKKSGTSVIKKSIDYDFANYKYELRQTITSGQTININYPLGGRIMAYASNGSMGLPGDNWGGAGGLGSIGTYNFSGGSYELICERGAYPGNIPFGYPHWVGNPAAGGASGFSWHISVVPSSGVADAVQLYLAAGGGGGGSGGSGEGGTSSRNGRAGSTGGFGANAPWTDINTRVAGQNGMPGGAGAKGPDYSDKYVSYKGGAAGPGGDGGYGGGYSLFQAYQMASVTTPTVKIYERVQDV